MTNTMNWYEKDIDDVYNHYSALTDEECYAFLKYLLQNYPKLEIAWIDMFEEIKEHLFNEGQINEVIEFVDNYRSAFPEEYESEYEFIERDLITHLFYKGDIDRIKERLVIIKANPVHGCDTVAKRALFQLLYYEQFDLALEYSNALWKPLFETEDLMGYPYAEFSMSIYLNKLEDTYRDIQSGKTINLEALKKEVEEYGFDEDKRVFEVVLQNLAGPLDKNTIASRFQDGSPDLLLTLNIQFLKYMKEKFGTPFMLSDRFWNILQKIDLFGHNNDTLEGFFYIPYPVLSEHVYNRYDQLYLSNEIEIFGKVFALKYPFEFLYTNNLISAEYYGLMKENIRMLEHEFMVNIRDSLWQMKFVFNWPQLYLADPYQEEIFSCTYNYYTNDGIEGKLNNYLKLYVVPERIQQEIDAYNEEKLSWHEENRNYNWEPPQPYVSAQPKIGRNDPCPCGSGKKYKKCCLGEMGE